MELKTSYLCGVWYILLPLIYVIFFIGTILAVSMTGMDLLNIAASFSIPFNIAEYIYAAIGILLYAIFMYGFAKIGKVHNKQLRISSQLIIGLLVFNFLVYVLIKIAGSYTGSYNLIRPLLISLGIIYLVLSLVYGAMAVLFGIGIKKLPLESPTKNSLALFSMLEGAAVIVLTTVIASIVLLNLSDVSGLFLALFKSQFLISLFMFVVFTASFIAFESFVFKLLFLWDTHTGMHSNKEMRDRLWIIIPLLCYLVIALVFITLMVIASKFFAQMSAFAGLLV